MEIRSYRRVFDLERRIYRIDQMRLNPGGVPVRGVVYSFAAVAATLVCDRLPLIATVLAPIPWFLRDLILPAAGGALLTAVRIDGRPFDKSLHALLRVRLFSRPISLRACSSLEGGSRWQPPSLLMLPDGSHGRLRRLRFEGPGAVHVRAPHRCERQLRPARRWLRRGARVVVLASRSPREDVGGRVIVLDRGVDLTVR